MPATNFNILTGLNVGNVTTDAAANSVATSGNITAGNLASTGLTSTDSFTGDVYVMDQSLYLILIQKNLLIMIN